MAMTKDNFMQYMKSLEDAGVITGWSQFMEGEEKDMRTFIKLTCKWSDDGDDNQTVYVNLANVSCVLSEDNVTKLYFTGDDNDYVEVKESLEEIKNLLKQAAMLVM